MRRFTVSLRTSVYVVGAVLALPVLIGLGAKWSARTEIGQLRNTNSSLQVENGNFRATTGELTTQIQSLENVIDELGARAELDPQQARAMAQLPAVVKAKAAGGNAQANAAISTVVGSLSGTPEDTFSVLKTVLQGLESRLRYVRHDVEQQEQLAAATPSIWPAHGWLTGHVRRSRRSIYRRARLSPGSRYLARKRQPGDGDGRRHVETAAYSGDYGNLIVLRHDFGLSTRYAHLSAFKVKPGQSVKRGDVIGYVGSTGRSTGAHLHYEILANGSLLDPLKLLTARPATIGDRN